MNTLYLIISLFAAGALVGMYLLALIMQNKQTPKFVSFIHGGLVVVALGFLIYYSYGHNPDPTEAITIFIIAAVGGITLIVRDISGKSIPKWLAAAHGIIAITGFIYLLVYAAANGDITSQKNIKDHSTVILNGDTIPTPASDNGVDKNNPDLTK